MKKMIEKIIQWNKIAENNSFNKSLEMSMLSEEFSETILAIKNKDKIEVLDGVLDMFIIWVWTLHKMWFNSEQISTALERIMYNNYNKFQYDTHWSHICIKDKNWKIMKPENFTPVDLSDLIPKIDLNPRRVSVKELLEVDLKDVPKYTHE